MSRTFIAIDINNPEIIQALRQRSREQMSTHGRSNADILRSIWGRNVEDSDDVNRAIDFFRSRMDVDGSSSADTKGASSNNKRSDIKCTLDMSRNVLVVGTRDTSLSLRLRRPITQSQVYTINDDANYRLTCVGDVKFVAREQCDDSEYEDSVLPVIRRLNKEGAFDIGYMKPEVDEGVTQRALSLIEEARNALKDPNGDFTMQSEMKSHVAIYVPDDGPYASSKNTYEAECIDLGNDERIWTFTQSIKKHLDKH